MYIYKLQVRIDKTTINLQLKVLPDDRKSVKL